MININDWEEIKRRYEQYWTMCNPTPILMVYAPKSGQVYDYPDAKDSNQFWFDAQWLVGATRRGNETTYFAGDAFPSCSPSLGPGLIAALLGLEINYNASSSWVVHRDAQLASFTSFALDKRNVYFQSMEKILEAYVADTINGDYIVGMVDLNTLMDGLSALIGPERLCLELFDSPQEVKRVLSEHIKLYQEVFTYYNNIVTRNQGGNTNWLGLYSEIPWYFISNDFMVMISGEHFEEFVDEPLREVAAFHPRNLFHLDGENAVIHLDKILRIPQITGVQVQATPFNHCAEIWIPHLKSIQASGKTALIHAPTIDDLMMLTQRLNPEGLAISYSASSEEEADEAVARVKAHYGK